MKRLAIAVLACLASTTVLATPISYVDLGNNVPVLGEISPAAGPSDNNTAQYFRFHTAGGNVVVDGSRIDGGFDMSFWVFAGTFADTNDFGAFFDGGDAGFIGFYDDSTGPAVAGPWGDPLFNGLLNAGWYTVAVTNFASNGNTGGDNFYDFQLAASGVSNVPEPLSLALVGAGVAALTFTRRRA